MAPSLISPGTSLVVSVHLLREPSSGGRALVTATLFRGQNSITAVTRDLLPRTVVTLGLEVRYSDMTGADIGVQVPGHLHGHDYRLEVEGMELTSLEAKLFFHSVALSTYSPSQVVMVRLDQAIFLPGQTGDSAQ